MLNADRSRRFIQLALFYLHSKVRHYLKRKKSQIMPTKINLETAKKDFIENNERFVSAVNKITMDNYTSIDQRILISTLHFASVESYNTLIEVIGLLRDPAK
jgi:hypothetical protein